MTDSGQPHGMRTLSPAESAATLACFAAEDPARSPWPNPDPDIVNEAWRQLVPPRVRADLLRRQAAELLRQADELEKGSGR